MTVEAVDRRPSIVRKLNMPTFEQAKGFAHAIGIRTERQWQVYVAQLTRADLYQRVVALMTGRIAAVELERP